jgi:uncharacterized protein DUF3597
VRDQSLDRAIVFDDAIVTDQFSALSNQIVAQPSSVVRDTITFARDDVCISPRVLHTLASGRTAAHDRSGERGARWWVSNYQEDCMSIFGNIMSAIFGSASAAGAAPSPTSTSAPATPGSASAPAATGAAPMSQVDVAAVLTKLAAEKKEKLDWRKSIVDLMKLLDLDSSLSARKELAKELHYSGDMNDSASMNIWLHKQVMVKLADNGGKVPEDLKS